MLKQCFKCKEFKPVDEFYKNPERKGGRYPNCIKCHRKYMRDRHNDPEVKKRRNNAYLVNRASVDFTEKSKKRSAEFYSSISGRARALWNNARKSPAGLNKHFTLTLEHVISGIETGRCAVTGVAFDMTTNHQMITGRKKNPYAPSVDRINSNLGYTNDNVRIVIWQYNMMKGELTDNELFHLCKVIVNVHS